MTDETKPPTGLSAPMRAWWSTVADDYDLQAHHLHLLGLACRAWDRADEARKILNAEGIVTHNRYGSAVAHPAVAIERDARLAFARLVRELQLDDGVMPEVRVPRRGGRR